MKQILVVGAGPVGLTLAAELARYRVPVRLIDKQPKAATTSRALVVWSRTLELMDRMGCTAAFLGAGLRAHGATIRKAETVLGHAVFDGIRSHYDFALMIPQSETERLLTDHLATLGVTIERGVELVAFAEGADGVAAQLRGPDGSGERMDATWLVGCDGAHSTVRHGLGLAFRGEAQDDDWMLADVRLEGDGRPEADQIAPYLHRDGPFVIFPIPGGRSRVIAVVGKTDPSRPRPDPTMAEVQQMIDERTGGGFKAVDPLWLSNFRINERKVEAYRHGRVMLAGDAAHVHSPAGGQGMNTGMQDAIALAWRLAMVMRGTPANLLDSYSAERSAVGDMVLKNATRMTDLVTLSNPAAQAARNLAIRVLLGFPAVRTAMATGMSEIAIGYPESPLSVGRHAGARLAPEHYDGPPPGAGSEPRFVVYAEDREAGTRLTRRFADLVEAEVREPPETGTLLVVRPDGYVGLSAAAADWDEAERYFGRWQRDGA